MLTFALHLHRWRGCTAWRRPETVAVTCGCASVVVSRHPAFARASGVDVSRTIAWSAWPSVLVEMNAWRDDDDRPRFIRRPKI